MSRYVSVNSHSVIVNSQLAAIAAADPVCPLYTCIFWAGIILSAATAQLVSVRQGLNLLEKF